MKYRPAEQFFVNALEIEISKYTKKLEKLHEKRLKWMEQYEEKQSEINEKQRVLGKKIDTINNRVIKRCKHTGDTHRRRCHRDDTDHDYHIICDDCDEWISDE